MEVTFSRGFAIFIFLVKLAVGIAGSIWRGSTEKVMVCESPLPPLAWELERERAAQICQWSKDTASDKAWLTLWQQRWDGLTLAQRLMMPVGSVWRFTTLADNFLPLMHTKIRGTLVLVHKEHFLLFWLKFHKTKSQLKCIRFLPTLNGSFMW